MSQAGQISITVWLAGRSYRLRINASDEEAVRKAVHTAENKVKDLLQHYAGKDMQDFLAMCLLMYASDTVAKPAATDTGAIGQQVDELIALIDRAEG